MKRRIICCLLAAALLSGVLPTRAAAAGAKAKEPEFGCVEVLDVRSDEVERYPALLVGGEEIYVTGETLGEIALWNAWPTAGGGWRFLHGEAAGDAATLSADGTAVWLGNSAKMKTVSFEDETWYFLDEGLGFLQRQFFPSDGRVVTSECAGTLLDYLDLYFDEICALSTAYDLLYTKDGFMGVLGETFSAGLTEAFNDFDPRVAFSIPGSNAHIADRYQDALLMLAQEEPQGIWADCGDKISAQVASMTENSTFRTLLNLGKRTQELISVPENFFGVLDEASALVQMAKNLKTVDADLPWYKLLSFSSAVNVKTVDVDTLSSLADHAKALGYTLNLIEAAASIYETQVRSKSWPKDFTEMMRVLAYASRDGFSGSSRDSVDFVSDAAKALVKESLNVDRASWLQGLKELMKFGAGAALNLTPLGPVFGLISAGMAVASVSGVDGIKTEVLRYQTKLLIDAEQLCVHELRVQYARMQQRSEAGTITQADIDYLRAALRLQLRINERVSMLLYYLHDQLDEREDWKTTVGETLIFRISRDLALLSDLECSGDADEALLLRGFSALYGVEPGCYREKITPDCWHEGPSTGNGTMFVHYDGAVYFFEPTAENWKKESDAAYFGFQSGKESRLMRLEDGKDRPEALFKTSGGSNHLGVWNGRVYYFLENKLYAADLDGGNRKEYGTASFIGADDRRGLLFCNPSGSGISVLDMTTGTLKKLTDSGGWGFWHFSAGWVYFPVFPSGGDGLSFELWRVNLNGTEEKVCTITDSFGDMTYLTSLSPQCACRSGATLFLYAGVDNPDWVGSFRGGSIWSIDLESGEAKRIVSLPPLADGTVRPSWFYLQEDENGAPLLFYYEGDADSAVRCYDGDGNPVNARAPEPMRPRGVYFCDGSDICRYADASGNKTKVVTASDYAAFGKTAYLVMAGTAANSFYDGIRSAGLADESFSVNGVSVMRGQTFFCLTQGVFKEYQGAHGMPWYTRVKSAVFRRTEDGKITVLYEF